MTGSGLPFELDLLRRRKSAWSPKRKCSGQDMCAALLLLDLKDWLTQSATIRTKHMPKNSWKIAVIPGDGIGKETTPYEFYDYM